MDNIIERVARHADIDTRRAMGFPPRKLPPCHFDFPERQDLGGYVSIRLSLDSSIIRHYHDGRFDSYVWVFGRRLDPFDHRCYAMDCMGRISIYNKHNCHESESLHHPDFNEDGTLKTWQSL